MAPRPPRLGILQLGTPGHCNVLWQHTDDWQCSVVTLWTDLASVFWSEAGEERVVSLVVVTCLVSSLLKMVTEWSLRIWSPLVRPLLSLSALHYFFVAYFLLQNKTSHLFWYLSNLSVYLQYCCFLRETVETSGQDLKFEHSTFEISFIRHNFADKQNNVSNCFIFWKSWRYFLRASIISTKWVE